MADEEAIRRKRKLLAVEMERYFLETCPALTARGVGILQCRSLPKWRRKRGDFTLICGERQKPETGWG